MLLGDPTFLAPLTSGIRLDSILAAKLIVSVLASPTVMLPPSVKLPSTVKLPVAVILPSTCTLPVPVMLKPLKSKLEPKLVPAVSTALPPAVVPSPTYSFLVSVVYTSSPSNGVTSCLWASVPLLNLKAIYCTPSLYNNIYAKNTKSLSLLHELFCTFLYICF